ncbi:hypothetical protein AAVH_35703 [Aphelenchoides avenae]|nr:hypothetical protein AAVH_35703 [Aphelenchus avenae]
MKAFFATLLLVSILLYSVNATCVDKDGKEVRENCQRCGPRKQGVWICKSGNWQVEKVCRRKETCKESEDCEAKCEA